VVWNDITGLDDGEDDRGHVKHEERHLAAADEPEAGDWTLFTVDAGHEHLARHISAQRLRLRVAADAMTRHVYRPVHVSDGYCTPCLKKRPTLGWL